MGNRATNNQINRAKEMLAQGVKPETVAVETGCGISTIYKIKRNMTPEEIQKITQSGPVTTRMMNQAEIEKYGPPRNPAPGFQYPKECRIAVGPVRVDHLETEIKEATGVLRTLGVQSVHVLIETKPPSRLGG